MDLDKKIRITPGLLISYVIILIPSFAWLIGFDFAGKSTTEIVGLSIEKTAAFAGMAMFGWSLILSGRYKILDTWFRGLDKMYMAHKFFGTACLALLLMPPLGNTIVYLYTQGSGADLIGHYLGYTGMGTMLGRISLYGLILLVLWSIFIKVKHETFIRVHRWLGVLFILGAVHAFMSGPESVLANNPFMWWYMLILSVLASITFIHFSLLNDFLHPYYKYKVVSNKLLPGDVLDIELDPVYRIANFKPGQFFYISFDDLDKDIFHPFSISSSKDDSRLRFLIKELGDHTTAMKDIRTDTFARVKGPYGGFTFNDKKHPKQLWIAGGIGVTPFLSKAHSLRFTNLSTHVKMFHFVRNEEEAIDEKQLEIIGKNHNAFDYKCIAQDKFGIVSLKDIAEQIGPLDDYAMYMCGPPPMLKAYAQQAKELGLEKQLYYEEFDY